MATTQEKTLARKLLAMRRGSLSDLEEAIERQRAEAGELLAKLTKKPLQEP